MITLAQHLPRIKTFLRLLGEMADEFESASVDELITLFRAGANVEGQLTESPHDPKIEEERIELSNVLRPLLYRIGNGLLARGSDAREAFLKLLDHESPWVRLQCASLALKVEPKKATATLEALLPLKGLLAAEAGLTLRFAPGGPGKFPQPPK